MRSRTSRLEVEVKVKVGGCSQMVNASFKLCLFALMSCVKVEGTTRTRTLPRQERWTIVVHLEPGSLAAIQAYHGDT